MTRLLLLPVGGVYEKKIENIMYVIILPRRPIIIIMFLYRFVNPRSSRYCSI